MKSARGWRGKRFGTATAASGSAPICSHRGHVVRDSAVRRLFGDRRRRLFLAALWQVTRIEDVRLTAIGAIRQALAGVHDLRETNLLGLYTGALGVCWAAMRAAISLEESGLVDEAAIQLRLCRDHEGGNAEEEWDLLAGQAGAILGLLWLWGHLGDSSMIEWAIRIGVALIAGGKRDRTGGLSWRGRTRGARALTGYSHGAAGAGVALMELGAAVRGEGFRRPASPRSRMNGDGTTPPKRIGRIFVQAAGGATPRGGSLTAWCHGAPGIALSRLRAMRLAPTAEITSELQAALATTSQATAAMLDARGTSFCLCHGLAGNAEVLNLCANGTAPSLAWRVATHCRRTSVTERAPSPDASPGLMLGRSGIGLFYLRLFDPSVPSVLLPYP